MGVVEADTEGLMTRGLQRSSLRSQLCNNDICGRCGKILSDVSACVVLGVVPCVVAENWFLTFRKIWVCKNMLDYAMQL